MKLIDADAAIIKIFDEFDCIERIEERGAILSERIRRLINTVPTVDAVPVVHGRWKEDKGGYGFWICSYCNFVSEAGGANILYKFCPNCGADMRKDGEHDTGRTEQAAC